MLNNRFLKILLMACMLGLVAAAVSYARDVTLQWSDADSTVTGYKVYYNADTAGPPFNGTGSTSGASPIDVKNVTSATVAGLDPAHAYYFAVTAYNASGTESAYSGVVSVAPVPTVSITSPVNGATASGTVSVAASASDSAGIAKVEFYVNNVLQYTDTATPYLYSWNTASLSAGTYNLMAKAYDPAGNMGQSANVAVSVVQDTTAPTVSISAPANGATVSGTVTLSANASDNIGVTKVEFYDNGTLLAATNVSPYSYSWSTSSATNGSHTLTAKAYDAAGNVGTSTGVAVTVNNVTADTTPPTVSLTAPANGTTVSGTVAVTAGASDNVGVTKVEFYLNGALKGSSATAPYSYSWNTGSVANGSYTLTAKAYDAAGNVGQSGSVGVTVNNQTTSTSSTYTIWPATALPAIVDNGPDGGEELGVRFRSDVSGYITGIRFYKASTNTGTHVGNLWSNSGTLLARATFSNESGSGWQQVSFATPVAIAANTVYVASYYDPAGHLSATRNYFATSGMDSAPLHALASGTSGLNGVYIYAGSSAFPNQSYMYSNYWVDVVFTPNTSIDTTAPTVTAFSVPSTASSLTVPITTFSASDNVGVTGYLVNESSTAPSATASGWTAAAPSSYTFTSGGSKTLYAWAKDAAGNVSKSMSAPVNVTVSHTIWPATALPAIVDNGPDGGEELGVRFRSDVSGYITGIRFYKASTNTGTHVGNLWSNSGTRLASATFTNESASGWQQVNFATPVAITANTVYVASYYDPAGHLSATRNYFATSGMDNAPLHALASGTSGLNGVYIYAGSSAFPNQSYMYSNYWVDVVFHQ